MDDSINYDMDEAHDTDGFEDSHDSDQQQTQSTQQLSQQPPTNSDESHLWGYFQSCNDTLFRIDFWKIHPRYTIGRHKELNQVVLPSQKISNSHAVIVWDGLDSIDSSVLVEDKSSNGTFINGEKIGKGKSCIIRDGNEIAFGTFVPQPQGAQDYRFIYRHTAGGRPTDGLFVHYDLATELGKGSFATVRKAMHKTTGRWFAVKMIHPSKSVGDQQAKNKDALIREISIMEKLDHRNICKLFEVFVQKDNGINLVLELVQGGDLLEYIIKASGLSEVDARDITYQMCTALAYIHSRGVAHRDLKPENVLLTNHRPPIVKIADFGLAKVVDSATMLRTMCGTPSYLAPEVVSQEDNEGYDNLVDSWSVGVIVYAMIANYSPFSEDVQCKNVKDRILKRQINWEPLIEKYPTQDAVNFIAALLQTNPEFRLSMTESVHHPWLESHTPFHPPDFDESISDDTDESTSDDMRMSVSVGFPEHEDMPHTVPHGSPTSALKRRKDVIAEADEGRVVLPEPSSEMIANIAREAPATPNKGQKKRVHAELSAVQEDSLEHIYNAAAAAAATRQKAAAPDPPPVVGSDSGENSDGRRRSSRRQKVARRG